MGNGHIYSMECLYGWNWHFIHARTHEAINTDLFIAEYRSGAALKRQFSTVPAQQAVLVL